MLVADLAQPREIALRWHQAAGRPGDGFDEARRDILGAVQRYEPLQIFRKFGAVRAFARREQILLEVRVAHVGDAR